MRRGAYTAAGVRRQRYQCTPRNYDPDARRAVDPQRARHVFSVLVPDRPDPDAPAARHHQLTVRRITHGLALAGQGRSYAEIGRYLSDAATDPWRRAADMVEVFGPVVHRAWRDTLEPVTAHTELVVSEPIALVQKPKQGTQVYALAVGRRTKDGIRIETLRLFPAVTADAYALLWDDWRELTRPGVPGALRVHSMNPHTMRRGAATAGLRIAAASPDPVRTNTVVAAATDQVQALVAPLRSRVAGLGNLARTVILLDVMTASADRFLDDQDNLVHVLWKDAATYGGAAAPGRDVLDMGRYRSLRDADLLHDLAALRQESTTPTHQSGAA